ncbi:MAG: nicotinate-nicotinamide nucleotide adenylyltransferase, partial [Proteobacteria bacterium]|nr:nicotinate-nicotinamide nucleotide adenylyltransferase [Pseudomonadota bacterium]
IIDQRELQRESPSYTIETLNSLHQEFPDAVLCLILGMDQFSQFTQWYQWEQIFNLTHIALAPRTNYSTPFVPPLDLIFQQRHTTNPYEFNQSSAGRIWTIPMSTIDISSTNIRAALANHETKIQHDLPLKVWEYIVKNQLYKAS